MVSSLLDIATKDEEERADQGYEPDDSSSTGSNNTKRFPSRDTDNPDNEAENLVKIEARAVRFLRGAVIILLVAATTVTGIYTYRQAAKNQIDTFTRDFEALAARFVDQFENGVGNYLFQSFTLSEAISGALYAGFKPTFPQVTLASLDSLASSLRLQARALDVIWSPLLKTNAERASWEKYATTTSGQQSLGSSSSGQNQLCYLCGEGFEFANLSQQVVVPGIGTFTCETIQQGALTGILSSGDCADATKLCRPVCGCIESTNGTTTLQDSVNWKVSDGIFRLQNGAAVPDHGPAPFSPVWQIAPTAGGEHAIMFNQMSDPRRRKAINAMIEYNIPVFSQSFDPTTDAFYKLLQTPAKSNGIVGELFFPVYESLQSNNIAGSLVVDFPWKLMLEAGLTAQSDGIVIVLENDCGQAYSFKVIDGQVDFFGDGDLHDATFDDLMVPSSVEDFVTLLELVSQRVEFLGQPSNWGCTYNIRVYPSSDMRSRYITSKPRDETLVVVSIFLFTSMVFLLYDFILRRLQTKVMKSAKRSEAIVSSLFPAVVRDRLYEDGKRSQDSSDGTQLADLKRTQATPGHSLLSHRIRMKSFLAQPTSNDVIRETEPIADLFPFTTVLFADIAGFTAWSSEREPAQVFKLLETLYGAFDKVANKLGVFKIETIGDCYVAVTGLPEAREDHAVVMAKFAADCIFKMSELSKKLESSLGPGTADLALRVGLHSGPVIGGVLRGERARFQLFGDTMNTASRMESNGKVNQIHVSKETAELLIEGGKPDWVEKRSEMVSVKGKGEMQTYWASPTKPKQRKISVSSSEEARSSSGRNRDALWGAANLDVALADSPSLNRRERLIAWNADLLEQFLQKIVARRKASMKSRSVRRMQSFKFEKRRHQARVSIPVVDEITEIIKMPEFSEQTARDETDPAFVDIGAKVRLQLRDYVTRVDALYHDNAFHNFEHASHVAMSASKLLKRIITPDDVDYRADASGKTLKSRPVLAKEIHDTSYGISSDPLMQFAVIFSALIHDVDHTGLQNRQLVKKNDPLALSYLGKCVAEQHSIQCAWEMLMEDRFADLRRCIFPTEEDGQRFRQLVVNAVIATDIADTDLQTWRQKRWGKAFHEHQGDGSAMDRKATLLFEYILQASDVAPTMQHWHVYQKWNQRLFEERYIAFVRGSEEEDPSLSWHQSELDFFDNYVIPLARNLEESNVFGVSCDDLSYALENRREWEFKGEQLVHEMVDAQKSLIAQLGPELNDEMLV